MTDIWELRKGDILVGRLTITDVDMLSHFADFEPTPKFEQYRQVFEEGSGEELLEDEAWEAWYQKVHAFGLKLVRLRDNATASEFILYIADNRAGFRAEFDDM